MGSGELFSHSYWFFLSYGQASGNWLVILYFLLFPIKSKISSSWLLCLLSASCLFSLAHSLTLMMKEMCSSKTLVILNQTAWHYIPEDRTLSKYKFCKIPHDFHSLYALSLNKPRRLLSSVICSDGTKIIGNTAWEVWWNKGQVQICITILLYELS
jgi:hypothetical protein